MVHHGLASDSCFRPLDCEGSRPPENSRAQDRGAVNDTGFGVNRLGCSP